MPWPAVVVPHRVWLAATAASLALLAGCANLGYYWQSASGHLALMRAARPVPEWLADHATPAELRQKLVLAQRMRRFASERLGLPDNRSYTAYADLHRPAAVWNVVAALPYSLTLRTWCFPIAGCVGYRGYYAQADAQAEAARLRTEGLEAAAYAVPAYSTLGWLDWAGGDPLLSTFIGYPEGELARLIFHELAHQRSYVAGDTEFNESFATAVERLGGTEWLATQAGPAAREEYARFDAQRSAVRALAADTRRVLADAYASGAAQARDWPAVDAMKKSAMDDFRGRYRQLRAGWSGARQGSYDAWAAQANNATFGAQAAYDALVPAFEQLFERQGRDWPCFYAAVQRIGALPTAARRADALRAEAGMPSAAAAAGPAPGATPGG